MYKTSKKFKIHFVGIGGIGMSGIAEVLCNEGFKVSGSDLSESETTKRLTKLGIEVFIGHESGHVKGASVVVVSSAVKPTNPEVIEARRLRTPIIPRAEMLGELMRGKIGLAVAGSHGKTTTTTMLALAMIEAGLDPTIVIGGKVDSFSSNAKLGKGEYLVAEADESDGSFLHLPATYGVITNIDNDHLDHYGSIGAIEEAFINFVAKIPFYGSVAVCGDDAGVRRCLSRFTKPVVTYGFSEDCDFFVRDLNLLPFGAKFKVYERKSGHEPKFLTDVEIKVPGKHYVLNALAALTLTQAMDIPAEKVALGLSKYAGVDRRFQIHWQNLAKNQVLVEDYGHHPTEILATLSAARGYWPGRIITAFQPHRYSRTLNCYDAFLSAFKDTDILLMSDIYAAGEEPIEGVSSAGLVSDISKIASPGQTISYLPTIEEMKDQIIKQLKPGDLILCLGAGSIHKLPVMLLKELNKK